ncbi:phosphoglycerate mutase family protein [Hanstruepera marina]|uniref:phosphoglycerate mutase family protein n=1 Tax=Hanstruepera marina TaxID=2873265 RepID=UPI001CA6701A|nr:phosphoglycerate mutase family protein [Hanstruepera marina]
MKLKTASLLCILLISLSNCAQNNSKIEPLENNITTFYFIRHAEKDRNDKTNRDPHLTEIGKARADHWNDILKHVMFDAVYTTDYHRTKETARPTAKRCQVDLTIYNPKDLNIKSFKTKNSGKNVLIVGHSNTTPMLVNQVIGKEKYSDIDDRNNGNLYVVTIINGVITDQVLEINPR